MTRHHSPATNHSYKPEDFAGRRYHFIGIGGIGMSSLARLLMGWGAEVSGSDRSASELLDMLRAEGAAVFVGHSADNLDAARLPDVVVYSKAVPDDNPELRLAREKGVTVLHRAELLGRVMESRQAVCVCGTHGKTTTTAMLTTILVDAGLDPAVMLGGVYAPIGGNVRHGSGTVFVAEACEAYGSFLSLYPDMAIVTNIEPDHLDKGATFEDIKESFRTFLGRVPEGGVVVAGLDSPEVADLVPCLRCKAETYRLQSPAMWSALPGDSGEWNIVHKGESVGSLRLQVPGQHNLLNALGAIAVAHALGVSPAASAASLEAFTGVDRRFSVRGAARGVTLVDDYAHHPSEVRATLQAAREWLKTAGSRPALPMTGRIIAAFQPHLYSRTALFMDEFADSFDGADIVAITEIYAAREAPIAGITGAALAERIRKTWPEKTVFFAPNLAALTDRLADVARGGDLVLTLGAGDITSIGPILMEKLGQRAE